MWILAWLCVGCGAPAVVAAPETCGANGWPGSGAPLAEMGTAFSVGALVPELLTSDQLGDPFCLSQLDGRGVVGLFIAMYTTPALYLPQELDDALSVSDVVLVTIVAEDTTGEPPDTDELARVAEGYALSGPVVTDPGGYFDLARHGAFPATFLVDRDRVLRGEVAMRSCADVAGAVGELLGEESGGCVE